MIQTGDDARLALEALLQLTAGDKLGTQDLDGNRAVQARVAGFVHLAMPPAPSRAGEILVAGSEFQDTQATALLGPILAPRGPAGAGAGMRLPLVVGGVAGIVLLIATVNVANLLMLRAVARQRELAVRAALDTDRAHRR